MAHPHTNKKKNDQHSQLLNRCLSIDLEVNPKTDKVISFAAMRSDGTSAAESKKGMPSRDLDLLQSALKEFDHPIGHNFIKHDMEHLVAARSRLSKFMESPIDTLWLNPLAFPRNPYHSLVKHHIDGRLQAGHVNDPKLDAMLVFEVLAKQLDAFVNLNQENPDALLAYHWLTTRMDFSAGFDAVFSHVREATVPSQAEAFDAIRRLVIGKSCAKRLEQSLERLARPQVGWPMAYALSWISVAGGDSVMPPWVRAEFRDAPLIVRGLRDTACKDPGCQWCTVNNDPVKALRRWFGFESFRPEPADDEGHSLQERIVQKVFEGKSVLGILPTGTGKSVCYQVPALSKYDKTGALTVVISPLVALMADQVHSMELAGISSAVTINSMLSMPERQNAFDKVRMGDASILIISPEQLRSPSTRSILKQREIGLWVVDEAHCVSKWGHDFRTDYRYIGRFIKRKFLEDQHPAPLVCLTATAKPEVVRDIRQHFSEKAEIELLVIDGGSVRTNLTFDVQSTQQKSKLSDILNLITEKLPAEDASGAVVYCATRNSTERVADFLVHQGMAARHFHAGLTADEKKETQERFRTGDLRTIAATNAFGMGIDKPDIRLVVHHDIPGSLENYLQEAGRAGRDGFDADCVLLYSEDDIERQFHLSARSRLAQHEIGAILRAIKRIDERTQKDGEVVATSGEIVREEKEREFERDSATDDTRVKTAVSWLEEAVLLTQEENRVQIYPSSLKVRTVAEAQERLAEAKITQSRREQLLAIVQHLMSAPADKGISTDELCGVSRLSPGGLNRAMADLEALGIASNDVPITVFVHVAVEKNSKALLSNASGLESNLIKALREAASEAKDSKSFPLHLSRTCQALQEQGHAKARPDMIEKLLRGLSQDGRDQDGGQGNIHLRKSSRDSLKVTLQRSWDIVDQSARLRRDAAAVLLSHLIGRVPEGKRGKDIQVETTMGKLLDAITVDINLKTSDVKNMTKFMGCSLLWLHEQDIVTLGKGLMVFRPAMTVHLNPKGGNFTKSNFLPLEQHYEEQTAQTHVMEAYAERGLVDIDEAQQLAEDYFVLDKESFRERWLRGKGPELRRQTTKASWKKIVTALGNPVQQEIVTDERERTNVLVLAGPGSGKTKVLVHRIAFLLRVMREDARGILVLAYNRHAATEIRVRLRQLVGDDANGVTVSTCHSLAMRLIGASFTGQDAGNVDFDRVLVDAVNLLSGEGLAKSEAEAQREVLIQGYRWILVDEYQDIGREEYDLISAVAGRSIEDPDLRLSLFAVGDDDQNIYAFAGASIEYIRRFEQDYSAKPKYLTENYRSTRNIIGASNAVILPAMNRMKTGHDITIDTKRNMEASGGDMERVDPVAKGRVQILDCPAGDVSQATAAIDELFRISRLDPEFNWAKTAVIARQWKSLEPARACAENRKIPVEMANEKMPSVWRLREMQDLVAELRKDPGKLIGAKDILGLLNRQPANRWTDLISEGIGELGQELGENEMPTLDVIEWLAGWSHDTRGEQHGLLLLTAHRAKGLEFDHVVILDGGWDRTSEGEDQDAPRRLFYVAMTRARKTLSVMTHGRHQFLDKKTDGVLHRKIEKGSDDKPFPRRHYVLPDMKNVDLSYAGRLGENNEALIAIAQAQVGDGVLLKWEGRHWVLRDHQNRPLGHMAKAWKHPEGMVLEKGSVGAVVRWKKVDGEEKFRSSIKRDEWETVLPELVFRKG